MELTVSLQNTTSFFLAIIKELPLFYDLIIEKKFIINIDDRKMPDIVDAYNNKCIIYQYCCCFYWNRVLEKRMNKRQKQIR
jgi:hypothetical protein